MWFVKKAEDRERQVAHVELNRMVEQVRQRNAEHARWIPCFHALSRWLPFLEEAVDKAVRESTLKISYKCHIRTDLSGDFPFGSRLSGCSSYDQKIMKERNGFENFNGWDRGYPIAMIKYDAPRLGGAVYIAVGETFGFFGGCEPKIWFGYYCGRPDKRLIESYKSNQLTKRLVDWWLEKTSFSATARSVSGTSGRSD